MKKYKIVFSPKAITDIEEAISYYNQQLLGLGNKFISELKVIYKAIDRNPFFAALKYDNVRCAVLKKFPFAVHFTIDEERRIVTIAAVFNTWKEPFW